MTAEAVAVVMALIFIWGVIFALIAADELDTGASTAVAVIGMTVLLSVFAHGLSARPLATRYGGKVTFA